MRYVWTIDPLEELDGLRPGELTREWLSELLRCHINTVYNYEEIIKESLGDLKDAKKYYEDENGNPQKWVELNEYLGWLICNVKDLHGKLKGRNKREQIKRHFFIYCDYYTEESYQYEAQRQRTKKTVQQPEQQQQTDGFNDQGKRAVAA